MGRKVVVASENDQGLLMSDYRLCTDLSFSFLFSLRMTQSRAIAKPHDALSFERCIHIAHSET